MARIPTEQLDRIKSEVSLLRLAQSQGLTVTKQGKDSVVSCPFHEEDTPSCIISPKTNLFHCFGCGAGGSVIDWVMKTQGVSFRLACELLQKDIGAVVESKKIVKKTTVQKLTSPLAADLLSADSVDALREVVGFYHATLLESNEVLGYLERRGLNDEALIKEFTLGYANRTLAYYIPHNNREAGGKIRERLKRIGIIRESGHEHFNGSLVVPIINSTGHITEVYGRKLRDDLRPGTPKHLYLPGAHVGVFNEKALKNQSQVILCESLIDAMTFWVHGFKNVTTSYGTQGFTDEILQAFKRENIQRIYIAYDRDEAGNRAAEALAEQLQAEGFECFRVLFPLGMDANQYALEAGSKALARDRLDQVIRKAQWVSGVGKATPSTVLRDMNDTQACVIETTKAEPTENSERVIQAEKPDVLTALRSQKALKEGVSGEVNTLVETSVLPSSITTKLLEDVRCEVSDREVLFDFSGRLYRVRGLAKNTTEGQLKINVMAANDKGYHTDSLELYHAKQRQIFINQASLELGVKDDMIKADLGRVLLKLETLQDEQRQAKRAVDDGIKPLTSDEQAQALELLRDPDLLNRILKDFNRVGLIGEDSNKLVGYLACVSRKLPKPLGVVIQSSSAAGKSSLMDAVLALMPQEERVSYSAMTGQSLYYLGETYLKHKILAIAEEEGAHNASYALKLLQSEGEVKIASTGKDETSGDLVTKEYRVEGPTQLFMTTTAIDVDEELMNRCLVLSVDESTAQTQEIHRRQRQAETLEGLFQDKNRAVIIDQHQNAQRLLKSLAVVNPYAEHLTFLSDKTRTRRDHVKYLTLIKSITLLRQYQRELKTETRNGVTVEYVEVTLDDIDAANQLAHQVLGRTLDELPPQTRKLLSLIQEWVQNQCQEQGIQQNHFRFSRRQVRELTGWSDNQLKVHCLRLQELEYLLVHRGGRGASLEYELLYDGDGEGRHMMQLVDVKQLKQRYDSHRLGAEQETLGYDENKLASSCPQVGGVLAPSWSEENRLQASVNGASHDNLDDYPQNRTSGAVKTGPVIVSARS